MDEFGERGKEEKREEGERSGSGRGRKSRGWVEIMELIFFWLNSDWEMRTFVSYG